MPATLIPSETGQVMRKTAVGKLTDKKWDMVITPKYGWFNFRLKELWDHRGLIWLFVKRDFVIYYKQTIFGPLWYIIQPVSATVLHSVIFGKLAEIPTDGLPLFLFYMSGNMVWGYFGSCFSETSNTFITYKGLFGSIYFPRLTVPISKTLSNLIKFSIQFSIFTAFWIYYVSKGAPVNLSWQALLLPLLLLQVALVSLGFGCCVSALVTRYRDLTYVASFAMSLGVYASPVVYPLSLVPEQYRFLYVLNPMAAPIELFRAGFLGQSTISFAEVMAGWLVTIVILFYGLILFNRMERSFADTV